MASAEHELAAPATRLAVDADADFHFVRPEFERRLAGRRHGARRKRNPERARARVHLPSEIPQVFKPHRLLGRGAEDLLHHESAGDAAPSGRPGRVGNGDVVVGDDRFYPPVAGGGELARHLEVHDVAFVVLDDQQGARASVDCLNGCDHLVGRRRGEHLARTGRVEHPETDEAGMQGFVAGAAAGDQRDLARGQRPSADEFALGPELDDVGMRSSKAIEAFVEHGFDRVHQPLHPVVLPFCPGVPRRRL